MDMGDYQGAIEHLTKALEVCIYCNCGCSMVTQPEAASVGSAIWSR